jgi:hypothetical protein
MGVMEAVPEPLVPEPKESRISRFLARRWAVPLVIAGAVTVVSLACITPDLIARWQLSWERDAIRARGEPATLAELAPEMPDDDDNAAVLLTQAFKLKDAASAAEPADWEEFLYVDGRPHRADAETAVKLHAKAMAVARKALRRPRCVFDVDYTKGANVLPSHIMWLRGLARLFKAEAILHALDRDGPAAADSICQILALARTVEEEPLLISQITVRGVALIGMSALKDIEDMGVLGDAEHRLVIEQVASLDFEKAATQAQIGERVMMVDGWDNVPAPPAAAPAGNFITRWFASRGMKPSPGEKLRIMRLMTEAVDASRLPPWQALKIVDDRCIRAMVAHPAIELDTIPKVWVFIRFVRTMADRDSAIIGLSCELFRSAKGRYPTSLDELAPELLKEVPPDPFTGKPFHYQLRDEGRAFIVYSVGDNLTDDGGIKKRPAKDDIAWEGKAR